jgi:hypothetical protein
MAFERIGARELVSLPVASRNQDLDRRITAANAGTKTGQQTFFQNFLSHGNFLDLVKSKLVVGSVVKLRRARRFVRRNLLRRLKGSFVF